MHTRSLQYLAASAVLTLLLPGATRATADEPCEPQWDSAIGQPGMNSAVWELSVYAGDIVAGGVFTSAGGQTVFYIARWDGSAWHPFESGGQIGVWNQSGTTWVGALTEYDGDLFVGGKFGSAGGLTVFHLTRWDGQAFHQITSGGQTGVDFSVSAFTEYNGDLIIGGNFFTAGGQTMNHIARWDGQSLQPFVSDGQIGVSPAVGALAVHNGDLIAAGTFTTAGGQTVNHIARWDGDSWHALSSGGQIGLNDHVWSLAVLGDDLIAGGDFTTAGGQTVNHLARWDGESWHPLEAGSQIGVDSYIRALTVSDGNLIVGGNFTTAGGQEVNGIARWDGSDWHPFESGGQIGVDHPYFTPTVLALTVSDGDVIAGGNFTTAGGETVNRIARWDGCTEPPVPGDLNGDGVVDVSDLLILLGAWGPCPDPSACPADLNSDGAVDVSDLLILLADWG